MQVETLGNVIAIGPDTEQAKNLNIKYIKKCIKSLKVGLEIARFKMSKNVLNIMEWCTIRRKNMKKQAVM